MKAEEAPPKSLVMIRFTPRYVHRRTRWKSPHHIVLSHQFLALQDLQVCHLFLALFLDSLPFTGTLHPFAQSLEATDDSSSYLKVCSHLLIMAHFQSSKAAQSRSLGRWTYLQFLPNHKSASGVKSAGNQKDFPLVLSYKKLHFWERLDLLKN